MESLKSMLKDSGFSILLRKNYDALVIKVVEPNPSLCKYSWELCQFRQYLAFSKSTRHMTLVSCRICSFATDRTLIMMYVFYIVGLPFTFTLSMFIALFAIPFMIIIGNLII